MSRGRRPGFTPRTMWSGDDLETDRRRAIDDFRQQRMAEPLEEYLDQFDGVQGVLEELLESTVDLTQLEGQAVEILTDPLLLDAFRYLAGPPISVDDLKTLVDNTLSRAALREDPDAIRRAVDTILVGLDRRRFPWIMEGREPTAAERDAAILATASMIALRRTETVRRNEGKNEQEERVRMALLEYGFAEIDIPGLQIDTLSRAPRSGGFCREVALGERKADLVVGLWDGRVMPIECKVSNSSTNSIKRLNNDAAVKAERWIEDFGATQVVPTAVLSGVYKLRNLEQAQRRGLTLYWAHRLEDLITWIGSTRTPD